MIVHNARPAPEKLGEKKNVGAKKRAANAYAIEIEKFS